MWSIILDKSDLSDLDNCSFYHGHGTQKQWVESEHMFLNYVGTKFGQSVRVSLVSGEVIVMELDEDLIPKLKTLEEKKKYFDGLEHWSQKLYDQTKEEYVKFSLIIIQDLSSAYGILLSIIDVTLHNWVEVEPEHQKMITRNCSDAIILCQLARKTDISPKY